MRRVCAWCDTVLSEDESDTRSTHTICPSCRSNIDFQMGVDLRTYLDSLPIPVFVVDTQGAVITANNDACALIGNSYEAIAGRLGGDIFECAFARLPGGCGHTIHCSGCTIRRTVTITYQTGESCHRVPARLTKSLHSESTIELLISTEMVGKYVSLTIEMLTLPAPLNALQARS